MYAVFVRETNGSESRTSLPAVHRRYIPAEWSERCACCCVRAESGDEERRRLRHQAAAAQEQVSRLTAQREEAGRTADMLRTELRVALEALQNQRREADLRLLSSSDTRLHVRGEREGERESGGGKRERERENCGLICLGAQRQYSVLRVSVTFQVSA